MNSDSPSYTMDDAKTKREVRRRKILENSEKRLQKITRCKLEETDNIEVNFGTSSVKKPSIKEPSDAPKPEGEISQPQPNTADKILQDLNLAGYLPDNLLNEINKKSSTPSAPSRVQVNKKIWHKLGFKLTILAIIVRIVHIFKLGYFFGETIVIPFALFMMTQLGTCQFDQNAAGITGPILIFIGISPSKIKTLLVCYNVVTSILVYFAIYFFSFVCAHLTFVMVFGL